MPACRTRVSCSATSRCRGTGDGARRFGRGRRARGIVLDSHATRSALSRPRTASARARAVAVRLDARPRPTTSRSTAWRRCRRDSATCTTAIAFEQRAVDRVPLPQQVGLLGDLYRATGDRVNASRQYALIGVIEKVLAANGVKNDLDIALFDADHGIALRHALTLARKGYLDRPSVFGDDVLGWVLARNGRCDEALAVLEAIAPARHAGRPQVLPSRLDRQLPRRSASAPQRGTGGPWRSTHGSRCSGHRWRRKEHFDEEAHRARLARGCAARTGRGAGASARQLHDQPFRACRGRRPPPLRALRPRHGRDPDVPGAAAGRGPVGLRAPPRARPARDGRRASGRCSFRSPTRSLSRMGVGGLHTMRLEADPARAANRGSARRCRCTTRTTPTGSAGRRS